MPIEEMTMKKILKTLVIAAVVIFVAIQFIPFGKPTDNPPVTMEPKWDSPQTRELVKAECFQCHSNETEWPWYSKVAPASWLLAFDVAEGRQHLNFSEWDKRPIRVGEMIEEVGRGSMPPVQYTTFHPETKLQGAELDAFIAALQKTFK